mgnify:CR=1 FL=1
MGVHWFLASMRLLSAAYDSLRTLHEQWQCEVSNLIENSTLAGLSFSTGIHTQMRQAVLTMHNTHEQWSATQ